MLTKLATAPLSVIEKFFDTISATPQVEISSLIVRDLHQVRELTTAVFTMEAVVPTSVDLRVGNFVVATTNLLYIAHSQVKAGIDLSKLNHNDIKLVNDTVEIHLPAPQILNTQIDVNRSRVYDYNRGFLNLGPDVAPELVTLAQRESLQKAITAACAEGLLEQANQEAERLVTELTNNTKYKIKVVTNYNELTCQQNSG